MTERSSAALVGVASSARRGSAGRSPAVRLLARLLTALSRRVRALDRGGAWAGLWLALLRGGLRSALVVALLSGDGLPLRRNAATVKAALSTLGLRGQLSRCSKRCCVKHLFEVDGCRLLLPEMQPF